MLATSLNASGQAPTPALECQLKALPARAGQAPRLRLTLVNRSDRPLQVLRWGTPFEGWLQPFAALSRDGQALPYLGPRVKRAPPLARDFMTLQPGRGRSARFDLGEVYEVHEAGHYRVLPRLVIQQWHWVPVDGAAPRDTEAPAPLPLDCPVVEFRVGPPVASGRS